MFVSEYEYALANTKSAEDGRGIINAAHQRHFPPGEASLAEGVGIPGRCIFAQNDAYLELCNPGFEDQWKSCIGTIFVVFPSLFIILGWYGLAVHPLLFQNFYLWGKILPYNDQGQNILIWFGWLLAFPLSLGCLLLLYILFIKGGNRSSFFTDLRGRIRFNRKTRKVYVLRPKFCGGNLVFDWEKLVALMSRISPDDPRYSTVPGVLILYYGPKHAKNPEDEDAIFVGNLLPYLREQQAAALWEYIRRYMEIGPTVDQIPPNAPANFKEIPRYLPEDYFTFCGKPSSEQYRLEFKPGIMETTYHMLSQMTCSWPRFPPEWQSDSGLGEPEDRPVQTGAVMTALVYRAKGRLSPQDEVEFLTHYGTPEALAEAKARA